jgi:hypothetical protein
MLKRGDKHYPRMNIPASWEVVKFKAVEIEKPVAAAKLLK